LICTILPVDVDATSMIGINILYTYRQLLLEGAVARRHRYGGCYTIYPVLIPYSIVMGAGTMAMVPCSSLTLV